MGRPGRDEQAAHDRQDLREGIFARAKTDLDRTRWSRDWPWSRKRCRPRGHRTSSGKSSGKRSAGNPPAPFDEAGTGDVTMGAGLRPKAKGLDKPPDPTVRAPVLDPTTTAGGQAGTPLATLPEPIYDMALDASGHIWATTGGGPLVELDPQTGAVLA